MMLHIGVLTVRGEDYHPTRRLAEAAAIRSARIVPIHPYQVEPAYHGDQPILHGDPEASNVQVVMPRQGAEIKTACLPLIAHYEQMGVRVINGWQAIMVVRNKFFMLQAMTRRGLSVPDTIFAATEEGCLRARRHFAPDPTVLKPISGRQGTGLHLLAPEAPIPEDIEQQLNVGRGVLVQAYIPLDGRLDFRVLVVGRTVAGAITLKPPPGDFRANAHVGGLSAPAQLPQPVIELALAAAEAMAMEIAGVDIILPSHGRPMVIEVNSAPGFKAMEAATGKDIAACMVEYAKSVYSA